MLPPPAPAPERKSLLGNLFGGKSPSLRRSVDWGSLAPLRIRARMVAEGVNTAEGILTLGARAGVELPIAEQMADVLAGRTRPLAAAEALMLRPQKQERH